MINKLRKINLTIIDIILTINYIASIATLSLGILLCMSIPFIFLIPSGNFLKDALASIFPLLLVLPLSIGYFVVSKSLWEVYKSIAKDEAFTVKNGKRIRNIGIAFLAAALFVSLSTYVVAPLHNNIEAPGDVQYSISDENGVEKQVSKEEYEDFIKKFEEDDGLDKQAGSTGPVSLIGYDGNRPDLLLLAAIGLMMFPISEVFVQGAKLKEEQDLTV